MYSLPQSYNQTSKCKRCISSNAYGEAAGPGLTYGYAWPLSKRFNLEFSAGVGALWYREKKYPEGTYLKKEEYNANGVKCVPTEIAVSCCYLF